MLTVEGKILYELAEPLVQNVDHLHETFSAHCGNLSTGELSIAAGESTILYVLPEPVKRFTQPSLADISPYGLILPPRHLSTWRIVKMVFAQHNTNYKVTLEAGGWEVIKEYVKIGLGISIVTDVCLTERDREELTVLDLEKYFPKRSYGIVTRKGKFLSTPAQRFIELMNECFDSEEQVDALMDTMSN